MTPIEELKVDMGNVLFNYDPDCRKIAEAAIRLAECYREIAVNSCQRSLHIDSWKSKEEIVDQEASELFQGTKS